MYYIVDVNEFYVWKDVYILLLLFFYVFEYGWIIGISSMFYYGYYVVDGYVFNYGWVNCIVDDNFLMGEVVIDGIMYKVEIIIDESGKIKEKEVYYVCVKGEFWKLDKLSILDGGILGGGIIFFYDFFIIKNVFMMFLVVILLIFLWRVVVKGYCKNEGKVLLGI